MTETLAFDLLARDRASKVMSTIGGSADKAGSKIHAAFAGAAKTAMVGFAAALGAVGVVAAKGFGELKDAQAGTAQLAAGLKSTGNVAGVTVKHMNDLAASIQGYSGQTDDSIVQTEALLLTFTNIKNTKTAQIFDETTKAAADMAARMGGSAADSAVRLGKALNDPVKGITALTKVGVVFDAAQRKTIASLVKMGDTAGAQKVILAELNKEFGGSAKAFGDSGPGQIEKAKRSFEDFSQTIATTLLPVVAPALQAVAAAAAKLAPVIQGVVAKAVPYLRQLFDIMFKGDFTHGPLSESSTIVAVLFRIRDGFKAVGDFVVSTAVPALREFGGFVLGTVVPAVVLFGDALISRLRDVLPVIAAFVTGSVLPAVQAFAGFITGTVIPAVLWLADAFQTHVLPALQLLQPAAGFLQAVFGAVAAVIGGGLAVSLAAGVAGALGLTTALSALAGVVAALGAPITLIAVGIAALVAGVIYAYTHFEGFRNVVDDFGRKLLEVSNTVAAYVVRIWPQVQEAIGHAVNAVRDVINAFVTVVTAAWHRWGDEIMVVARAAWAAIQSVIKGATDVIQGIIQTVLSVINGDWGDAWNGIKQIFSGVWTAIVAVLKYQLTLLSQVISVAMDAIALAWGFVWEKLKTAGSTAITAVVTFMTQLPGRILAALTGLGTLLWGVGSDIIGGLIQGIRDRAEDLIATIRETVTDRLPGFVKKALGIASPSKLFAKLGEAIPDGLAAGIAKAAGNALNVLKAHLDRVQDLVQRRQDKLNETLSQAGSLRSAITSSLAGATGVDSVSTDQEGFGVGAIVAGLSAQLDQLQAFRANIDALASRGVAKDVLDQITGLGLQEGGKLAVALAAGNAGDLTNVNILQSQISALSSSIANSAVKRDFGAQITAEQRALAAAEKTETNTQTQVRLLAELLAEFKQGKSKSGVYILTNDSAAHLRELEHLAGIN